MSEQPKLELPTEVWDNIFEQGNFPNNRVGELRRLSQQTRFASSKMWRDKRRAIQLFAQSPRTLETILERLQTRKSKNLDITGFKYSNTSVSTTIDDIIDKRYTDADLTEAGLRHSQFFSDLIDILYSVFAANPTCAPKFTSPYDGYIQSDADRLSVNWSYDLVENRYHINVSIDEDTPEYCSVGLAVVDNPTINFNNFLPRLFILSEDINNTDTIITIKDAHLYFFLRCIINIGDEPMLITRVEKDQIQVKRSYGLSHVKGTQIEKKRFSMNETITAFYLLHKHSPGSITSLIFSLNSTPTNILKRLLIASGLLYDKRVTYTRASFVDLAV